MTEYPDHRVSDTSHVPRCDIAMPCDRLALSPAVARHFLSSHVHTRCVSRRQTRFLLAHVKVFEVEKLVSQHFCSFTFCRSRAVSSSMFRLPCFGGCILGRGVRNSFLGFASQLPSLPRSPPAPLLLIPYRLR